MDYTKKPFYLKEEDIKWVEETFHILGLKQNTGAERIFSSTLVSVARSM